MADYSIKRLFIAFHPNWACNEEERKSQQKFQRYLKKEFWKVNDFPNLFYAYSMSEEHEQIIRNCIKDHHSFAGYTEILVIEQSQYEDRETVFSYVPSGYKSIHISSE